MLLLNFLSTIAILSFFFTSSTVDARRCITKGTYLDIRKNPRSHQIKVTDPPEEAVLEEVGDKWCGFRLIAYNMLAKHCQSNKLITYEAVEVAEHRNKSFCSYWRDHAICVCNFDGCNSIHGVFYETVFNSVHDYYGRVKGEDYTEDVMTYHNIFDEMYRWEPADCLLQHLEFYYLGAESKVRENLRTYKMKEYAVRSLKLEHPGVFPKQEDIDKLLATTTTPIPNVPTMANASALISGKSGKDSAKKKPEDESWGVMPLVITVVLFVVVLGLVAGMIIAFICFRRKVNDNLTTIRSVASDTSMHGSVYLVPNTSATNDYFGQSKMGTPAAAPVAPVNGMPAPSPSKSSGGAVTGTSNKSLKKAAPNANPAAVSRK